MKHKKSGEESMSRPDREAKPGDPLRDPNHPHRKHDPNPSHDAKISDKDKSRDKQQNQTKKNPR
ncbi:MAG: hypothetical protein AB7I18_01605 [Candidatus Berkiella sp.]